MTLDECRLVARLLRETADLVERGLVYTGHVEIENEVVSVSQVGTAGSRDIPCGMQVVRIMLRGNVRMVSGETEAEVYEKLWVKRLEVIPDYQTLNIEQLLALWHEHRNSNVGIMAADEICRRVESSLAQTIDPIVKSN